MLEADKHFKRDEATPNSTHRVAAKAFALACLAVGAIASGVRAQEPELFPPTRQAAPAEPLPAQSIAARSKKAPPTQTLPAGQSAVKPATPASRLPLAQAMDLPGDFSARNMPIDAALFTISKTWQVNIIAGKEIQGSVNGVFSQTALREVLDAVLLANGYSYRAVGDSLVVQPTNDVGSANPLFRSMTLPITKANLTEIVEGATLLKSATGQVKALPSARSILVVDYADRVESIAAFIARMEESAGESNAATGTQPESQLEVAYFKLHFIPVTNAQMALMTVLSPLGRLGAMPHENRLLVVDYSANIEMVRKVLERIDRPRPQVKITALIYDLSLKDVERLGLNWSSAGKGANLDGNGDSQQALKFDTTTLAPIVAPTPGGAFTVRSLTKNFDITTVLNLLQNASDARLLADPNVTVTDNEMAETKSVSEIPYQQITQSELGGQIGTTAFKEAGITLRVQPTIAGDGTIEMMVEPEFSRLAGFTPQGNQPIIDTRKAVTRVRVANKQTIVISGLRQRSDTGEFVGIPWLKDVKYIGPAFRSRDTNVRESELIVFIMPEIVDYDQPLSGRNALAAETVNCRLEAIPPAEGCQAPCGADGCAGIPLALPPVDESALPDGEVAPEQMPLATPAEATASSGKSPMRPPYEARFRADGRGMRSGAIDGNPNAEPKKSTWKRLFRS